MGRRDDTGCHVPIQERVLGDEGLPGHAPEARIRPDILRLLGWIQDRLAIQQAGGFFRQPLVYKATPNHYVILLIRHLKLPNSNCFIVGFIMLYIKIIGQTKNL